MSQHRTPDDPAPDTRALAALLADEAVCEAFCRQHPELEPDVRRMRAAWLQLAGPLASAAGTPLASAAPPTGTPELAADAVSAPTKALGLSLAERIRAQFGEGVDPDIALEAAGESARAEDFSTEVLRKLAARPDSSGRYRIQGEVAQGGMGAILRVWDADLRRHLAMKVVLGKLAPTPGAAGAAPANERAARGPVPAASPSASDTPAVAPQQVARFLEEAQVTGQLDHPGVVPVHELGLDAQGRVFFTMKLVKGEDLKAVFARVHSNEEGWTVTRVLGLLQRACEAMAYAHSKGVIHRDLKPANVMIGKYGEVYVMDWGLARVLSRPDPKDLRLRPESAPVTTELRSERHAAHAPSDSPLVTMDGDIVGTPAYMPPEQAKGQLARLGPAADVYALGAMLYHLLAGRMPYVTPGAYINARGILSRVQEGPPRPVHEFAPDAPAELVAICERAMSREPEQRYADMTALADDLRAYLEHRVVAAYETGALAELRKWVMRNKPLAASLAAVFVLLVAGAAVFAALSSELSTRNADLQDALGRESSLSADLSAKNADLAVALTRESDALAAAEASAARADRNAEQAQANAAAAEAAAIEARREKENVLRLSAFRELEALQAEADALWPATPDRVPAYDDWLRRADALLAGLHPSADGSDVGHLRQLELLSARALPASAEEQQAARRAHPRFAELEELSATLAASEEAVSAFRAGLGGAEPNAAQQEQLAAVDAEIARVRVERDALETEIAGAPVPPRFASADDAWWYDQLERLVHALSAFADPETGLLDGVSETWGWGVRKRREFAATIEERTITGAEASRRWAEASASIGDRAQCPAYDGLQLLPQLGLLPIGRDPGSGLWEFWHVQSGDEPPRGEDSRLVLPESMGVVLVLIPGGTFRMGAQNTAPAGQNYDPQAQSDESPVHAVTLSPYLLSKYELTQGQWERCTGNNPSNFGPDDYDSLWNRGGQGGTALHPVEQVSWDDCVRVSARWGLRLPSEAQWEYACRAGTSSVYWSGDEPASLQGVANLADEYGKRHGAETWSAWEAWLDDGQTAHAPVGSYRSNALGLHDVHGNVWEWCLDGYGSYGSEPSHDPVSDPAGARGRVSRGGSFLVTAPFARSANRDFFTPGTRGGDLGFRPARTITTF